MPLFVPIVFGFLATTFGGYGVKRGAEGVGNLRDAKNRIDAARERHQRHLGVLEAARARLGRRIDELQQVREQTAREAFGRMRGILEAIHRRGRTGPIADVERSIASVEQVRAFDGRLVDPRGLLRGGLQAIGAGTGASALATGAVSAFATASTGTAISGLSGAAAHSAVLAWLGGGSLAAGGGGMAAGTLVLGGIVAAPALLVSGVVVAAQGERALNQAVEYATRVDVAVSRIDAMVALLTRAERRVWEVRALISAMRRRADLEMDRLEALVDVFDESSAEHRGRVRVALLLCGALRELIDCRVLDDDGMLDETTGALLTQLQRFLAPDPLVIS